MKFSLTKEEMIKQLQELIVDLQNPRSHTSRIEQGWLGKYYTTHRNYDEPQKKTVLFIGAEAGLTEAEIKRDILMTLFLSSDMPKEGTHWSQAPGSYGNDKHIFSMLLWDDREDAYVKNPIIFNASDPDAR